MKLLGGQVEQIPNQQPAKCQPENDQDQTGPEVEQGYLVELLHTEYCVHTAIAFAPFRHRPLPPFPGRFGVIPSPPQHGSGFWLDYFRSEESGLFRRFSCTVRGSRQLGGRV